MKFKEITQRLTGISTPIFGVSWNPSKSERSVARKVIAFLEDRRVLYSPSEAEVPHHCLESVLDIRRHLTEVLGELEPTTALAQSLSAMRSASRKFLDAVQADEGRIIRFGSSQGHYASWVFLGAIGELRGVFGVHVAKLAAAYGLNVESDLATILPAAEDDLGK